LQQALEVAWGSGGAHIRENLCNPCAIQTKSGNHEMRNRKRNNELKTNSKRTSGVRFSSFGSLLIMIYTMFFYRHTFFRSPLSCFSPSCQARLICHCLIPPVLIHHEISKQFRLFSAALLSALSPPASILPMTSINLSLSACERMSAASSLSQRDMSWSTLAAMRINIITVDRFIQAGRKH
jgi:hypothetical protein